MKNFLKRQWQLVSAWVNGHGGFTKVGAAGIVLAGLAYAAVPSFHSLCLSVWGTFPTPVKTLFVTCAALYSWLRNPETRKLVDGLLGPGDKVGIKDPVLTADGTLSGSSASITKADPPQV